MLDRIAHLLENELHEARVRVEAAAALLTRGLLAESSLVECAESALIWLDQADRWLERAVAA